MTRRNILGRLLVEASGNDQRKVVEGSVRLYSDGQIDWTERTRTGPMARTGRVDWETYWDLVDAALATQKAS